MNFTGTMNDSQMFAAVHTSSLFGGAVGNLSSLGAAGSKVASELALELGLGDATITWHTARDCWAEGVFWLALVGATLGKIGNEVTALMRTEVAEVFEASGPQRGSSSTMPQKRNPVITPILIAASSRLRDLVPSQLSAMIQDHERATAGQSLEWLVIPEAFVLASGSFRSARDLLQGITVDKARMLSNLEMNGGLLMSESVMMGLAPKIGRDHAHELVTTAAAKAISNHRPLHEELLESSEIMKILTSSELNNLLEPKNYLGSTQQMIDAILAKIKLPKE